MTEVKQYTREEFAAHLVEFYGNDFPGLAELVSKVNQWRKDWFVVAEYVNAELNPNSYYDRQWTKVREGEEPQQLIGDSVGTSRMYSLAGIYRGDTFNLGDLLKQVKIVRPTVVFVDAGYDVNGNNRRAWVLYREGELFRIIRDNNQEDHLWQDYGAEKAWASGKLSITEEMWEQLWDKNRWPVSDRRFPSYLIEELYTWGQNGFSDNATGDGDSHWAYKFDEDLTILHYDAWGNFSTETFPEQSELDRRWDELVEEYNPTEEDEDE